MFPSHNIDYWIKKGTELRYELDEPGISDLRRDILHGSYEQCIRHIIKTEDEVAELESTERITRKV